MFFDASILYFGFGPITILTTAGGIAAAADFTLDERTKSDAQLMQLCKTHALLAAIVVPRFLVIMMTCQ